MLRKSYAKEWIDILESSNKFEIFYHLLRYLLAYHRIKNKATKPILDLGCGSGYGTNLLKAVGLDYDIEALKLSKKRYRMLDFVAADAHYLPFRPGSFSFICLFEVIEHVECPLKVLQEVHRCLAPAGMIFVSTPNSIFMKIADKFFGWKRWHGHKHEFSMVSLRSLLRRAGFSEINISGEGLWLPKITPKRLFFLSTYLVKIFPYFTFVIIATGKKSSLPPIPG